MQIQEEEEEGKKNLNKCRGETFLLLSYLIVTVVVAEVSVSHYTAGPVSALGFGIGIGIFLSLVFTCIVSTNNAKCALILLLISLITLIVSGATLYLGETDDGPEDSLKNITVVVYSIPGELCKRETMTRILERREIQFQFIDALPCEGYENYKELYNDTTGLQPMLGGGWASPPSKDAIGVVSMNNALNQILMKTEKTEWVLWLEDTARLPLHGVKRKLNDAIQKASGEQDTIWLDSRNFPKWALTSQIDVNGYASAILFKRTAVEIINSLLSLGSEFMLGEGVGPTGTLLAQMCHKNLLKCTVYSLVTEPEPPSTLYLDF